jgi:flagellar protein FlaH
MYESGEEQKKKVISTGNLEIDTKMGGGVPIGSLTLIDGHSHSGKSVLSQQMIWGSLNDGFRLSLFTTENTVKSLITQMQSLNLEISDFLLLRKLKVYPMEVAQLKDKAIRILLQALKKEEDSDMVFVDALTPCIGSDAVEETLSYFEECKRLCSGGVTIVTIIHSHAVSKDLLVRIQSLCDAHIRLRTEEVGERLVKTMEVAKVRGASKSTGNIVSFEIEPGWGMKIIPISKARG